MIIIMNDDNTENYVTNVSDGNNNGSDDIDTNAHTNTGNDKNNYDNSDDGSDSHTKIAHVE